ncbi:cytochrome P450, partial [Mycobacterium tuberculosis]
ALLRGGPASLLFLSPPPGPVVFGASAVLPGVAALGPAAAPVLSSPRPPASSPPGWVPVLGPFFPRGLLLLAFA